MSDKKTNELSAEELEKLGKFDLRDGKIVLDTDDDAELASHRNLSGWLIKTISAVAVVTALFHMYTLTLAPMDPLKFRAIHVMLLSVIGFALVPGWTKAKGKIHITDWFFIAGAIGTTAYLLINFNQMIYRMGVNPNFWDIVVATIGIVMVLELSRRTSGWSITILALIFMAYAYFGTYFPGVFNHRGYSFERIITYMYTTNGIFSVPVDISSRYIILFVIFSAFLQVSGVGKFFVEWAFAVSGAARGGPAKVAVVSSALMGTMNGTSAGNVVATGSLTIPLMKKVGYNPQFAAATEAAASTGGQIMPPIMGAGIFIMAEMTGIRYQTIMVAGIIPAIIYFMSVYMMVDKEACRTGLHGFPRQVLPDFNYVMKNMYLFIPVVALFTMLATGFSVIMAGVIAIIATMVISWFTAGNRMGPKEIWNALDLGARGSIQLMAVCAAAGVIMGVIALTGIGGKFGALLIGIAGDNIFLGLASAMGIAILLGMGMPTTAAYAVAASVIAPGLIRMGVEPLMAHFFIFYYACLSSITPPVALAAFAASGISGTDPMKTSFTSFRLGIAAYIVPFMFYYAPEILIMVNDPNTSYALSVAPVGTILIRAISALIGVYALASAVQKWLFGPVYTWQRAVLLVTAFLLITPNEIMDTIGYITLVVMVLFQYKRFGTLNFAKYTKLHVLGKGKEAKAS